MTELNGTDQKLFDYYPRLKRLRQYVEKSYSEPIPLEKAAGIAALESTYFPLTSAPRSESLLRSGYVKSELKRRWNF